MKTFKQYINEVYQEAGRFRKEEIVSKILTPGRLTYMSDKKLLQVLRAAFNHKKYTNVKIDTSDKELRKQHRYDVVNILSKVDVNNIDVDNLQEIIDISLSNEGEIAGLAQRKPKLKKSSNDPFKMSQRKFFRKKIHSTTDEDDEAREKHLSSGQRIKDDSDEYKMQ